MNKYLAIFGTSFRQESKTLANSLISIFAFALLIFVFAQLWRYVYAAGGTSAIEGYTMDMMVWYLIGTEIIYFAAKPRVIVRAYSDDIISGRIAYQINKPYNYYMYQTSSVFGQFLFKFIFILISGIAVGLLLVGPISDFSAVGILPIVISMLLGLVNSCLMYGVFGLMSFWIEDSTPFSWILQRFAMTLGIVFPPEVFPGILQDIITYSPIYAMVSGPAKMLVNFSWELFLQTTLIQVAYIVIFAIISAIMYKRGIKKVNINGG